MSDRDIAVSVRDLSKSYTISHNAPQHETAASAVMAALKNPRRRPVTETFWALQDISFDIHEGEVLGIIGRNGAGKSTLLKILSRVVEPTTGRVDLYGRVGSLLEVGTGFHPDLTGRENVFLNGAILGMTKREITRHFDEIVAFAEVEQFLDTPVKRYSSGMFVRLAFAVAAHLEPEILIIDEVLAVGDAAFQKKCIGKMQDVAQHDGRTVLFVSHSVGSIRKLCTSVIWLKSGRLYKAGPTSDIIEAYMDEVYEPGETVADLRDQPRQEGFGDQVRLCEVVFNDGSPVCQGEGLSVRVRYEARGAFEEVVFGAGFSTLDGARIMTVESNLEGRHLEITEGGGEVEFRMDRLWLQPGHYTFDIGVGSGSRLLDYLKGGANVDVLPGPNTPSHLYVDNQATEGVTLPALWRVNGLGGWGDSPRPSADALTY